MAIIQVIYTVSIPCNTGMIQCFTQVCFILATWAVLIAWPLWKEDLHLLSVLWVLIIILLLLSSHTVFSAASLQVVFHGLVTHTHTHPFNGCLSSTTCVGRYQKGKTNLDVTEARDNAWQWHQLGHMQKKYAHRSREIPTPASHHCFLQAGCPSCRPTISVKALKAYN